jgi:hypothetical protein
LPGMKRVASLLGRFVLISAVNTAVKTTYELQGRLT